MQPLNYKTAGVDLEVYAESMRRLPALMRRTHSPRVLSRSGGFAGMFRLDFAEKLFARSYRNPVLVACTDGVGTKLKVAQACQKHDTVGIDLVAMSVNDALCCGAEPLFFLDYVAMSHDDPVLLEALVRGISDGCRDADCALLGGETAIMPDLYQPGDYDLAGFCVGVVEEADVIDGTRIHGGDVLLGIASTGLHSNGFSLARKAVFDRGGLGIHEFVPELGCDVGTALLRPTQIYVRSLRTVLNNPDLRPGVHGIAHITGGGLEENLQRILPDGIVPHFRRDLPAPPAIFSWIQRLGEIDLREMRRVFNLGIGMVLVVDPSVEQSIHATLLSASLASWNLGTVRKTTA